MTTFQKAIAILLSGFLIGLYISIWFAARATQATIVQERPTSTIYVPTQTTQPTPIPVTQIPNTATLEFDPINKIYYQENYIAGVKVSARDIMYLAALCVVETKSFREKRDDACKSIVSTVLVRAIDRVLSDGTIAGTITWDCKPGDIACQFPAYVVNGCADIRANMCPYNYSQHLIYYIGIVENFIVSDRETSCPFYPFYDLLEGGVDCRIEENGQYINFHDGRD